MEIRPYLFFDGRCDEAISFYKAVMGAEVNRLMRYKDMPPQQSGEGKGCDGPAPAADKVMHPVGRFGGSTVYMSDGRATGQPKFDGFSLNVGLETEAQAEKLFAALADGGAIVMPIGPTFFAKRFGMVADKFGVNWMIMTEK